MTDETADAERLERLAQASAERAERIMREAIGPDAPTLSSVARQFDVPKGHERVSDGGTTVHAWSLTVTTYLRRTRPRGESNGWSMYAVAEGRLVKKDGTLSKIQRRAVWWEDTIDSAPAWVRAAWMTARFSGPTEAQG